MGELGYSARSDFPINSCFIVAKGLWQMNLNLAMMLGGEM